MTQLFLAFMLALSFQSQTPNKWDWDVEKIKALMAALVNSKSHSVHLTDKQYDAVQKKTVLSYKVSDPDLGFHLYVRLMQGPENLITGYVLEKRFVTNHLTAVDKNIDGALESVGMYSTLGGNHYLCTQDMNKDFCMREYWEALSDLEWILNLGETAKPWYNAAKFRTLAAKLPTTRNPKVKEVDISALNNVPGSRAFSIDAGDPHMVLITVVFDSKNVPNAVKIGLMRSAERGDVTLDIDDTDFDGIPNLGFIKK